MITKLIEITLIIGAGAFILWARRNVKNRAVAAALIFLSVLIAFLLGAGIWIAGQ
jgi:hypothetical protein